MVKCFSRSLKIHFFNDIDNKISIDPLFNDFGSNCIVFLFFHGLSNNDGFILQAIYNILDLFFSSMVCVWFVY